MENNKKDNFIKDVFAKIWALWGLISFVVSFIIILPISMVAYLFKDYVKGQKYFIDVSRMWMRTWLFLIGCSLKVVGKENFKKGENYIVVFNHNALLDVPLSAPFIPGPNKTIAKDSFAKIPIFTWFYSRGSVLVNRKDEKSRIRSYDEMRRVLKEGMHMCIYPEGTRNRTDQPLKQFYEGAFKLSTDTGKSIIPCIITGTKKAMPIHKTFYLLPQKLEMHFMPEAKPGDKNAKELKDEVYKMMLDKYLALTT